jgi:hypothetical protein
LRQTIFLKNGISKTKDGYPKRVIDRKKDGGFGGKRQKTPRVFEVSQDVEGSQATRVEVCGGVHIVLSDKRFYFVYPDSVSHCERDFLLKEKSGPLDS